jgi:outer membrane receptor protein involved in Fe transport
MKVKQLFGAILPLGLLIAFLIFTVSVGTSVGWAQSTGGRIRGTVTDASGSAVVGAKVQLINEATNVSREAVTNSNGEYLFLEIPVGTYSLQIEQAGFKKFLHRGVELHLNDVLNVDAALQVGGSNQVVEVTGEPPVVDTTSTQLGAVVNSRDATELPLNQRDVYQLLQLQPGVQSQLGNDLFYGSDKAGVVTVNGGRGRSNNYSVNGGDGNDLFANLPAVQPSPDSIEEFRVITNSFDAEYGRNSGSVVNVVTKSGTNDWHGSGFEFFRNKVLNAKGFYDPVNPDSIQNQFGGTVGGPIKKDKTFFFGSYEGRRVKKGKSSDPVPLPTAANQAGDFSDGASSTFSGTLGSPQVADTLNARGTCGADTRAANGGVPIAPGASFGSLFPNGLIPTSCFDPLAVGLLGQYVHPTSDGLFQKAPNSTDRGDQFTIKVDHDLSKNQKLSAYYYFDDDNNLDPFSVFQAAGGNLGNFPGVFTTRTQQINVSHTWTIGSTMVNEARFSFFREGQQKFNSPQVTSLVQDSCGSALSAICFTGTSDTANLPSGPDLGIHPGLGASREGLPFISVGGGFSIGNNFEGQLPQTGNTFQVSDNFSKIIGNHSLKFGVDTRYQKFDQFLFFNVNGTISFDSGGENDLVPSDGNNYANYLLGLPSSYSQGSAQQEKVRSKSLYLYAQDSWKIKPNLTLNYGLRWELNTPLNDIGHKVQTFRPGQNSTIYPCVLPPTDPLFNQAAGITDCNSAGVTPTGLVFPGDAGVPLSLSSTYYKAFAPRLGLNWSPGAQDGWLGKLTGGPSKTSISAGWGLFYNPIEQLVLEQFSAEPPFGGSNFIQNPTFQAPFLDQDTTQWPNPFNGVLSPPRGTAINWETFRSILLFGQFPKVLRPQYSAQYNLTIKRELPGNILLQVGYVGSQGHRLLASYDINHGNPQTCNDLQAISVASGDGSLACGPFSADNPFTIPAGEIPAGFTLHLPYGPAATVTGPNPGPITLVGLRKYSSPNCDPLTGAGCPVDGVPVFSNIFSEDTIAYSNYNSLQVLLQKRYSHGLQFQAAYTLSKSLDNASSFESSLNPLDFNSTYGPSLYDARHRFVFSYVWQIPTPKFDGVKGALLSGWQTSGIFTVQSGFPIRITSGDDNEELSSFFFEPPGEPNVTGPFHTQDARKNGGFQFSQSLFDNCNTIDCPGDPTAVVAGTIGNAPRSICCNPGIFNFDAGLFKGFKLTERLRMEFRTEFYNLFNHTQLYSVDGNISDGPDFGKALKFRDPREIQFALKLVF